MVSLFGEIVPFGVSIDQVESTERMSRKELRTLTSPAQKGQRAVVRDWSDVKSMSPDPPLHAPGSLDGSGPENEKDQVPASRSTVTNRSLPGQFES